MHDPTEPLAWVARAEEDLALARSALRRKTPLTYGATFHAQQCAEKYLKALLLARHQVFPGTHDLAALSDLCLQNEVIVPVTKGALDLGPWQRIFYGEWDGQRPKRVVFKAMGLPVNRDP